MGRGGGIVEDRWNARAGIVRRERVRGWAWVLLVCGWASASPCAAQDDALSVAREIADRVATFPNFRGEVPHGEWREVAPWSVRSTEACHADLAARGIAFEPIRTRLTPIPAPVRLVGGTIGGVRFRKLRGERPLIVACELAVRMVALAEVLARHRVVEVRVMSAWRREPATSFHTMGLALDLESFVRDDGSVLDVARDYVIAERVATCADDRELDERASALRALACQLAESGVLSTVITPAYSPGHRSHLHIDARPTDPRLFVR